METPKKQEDQIGPEELLTLRDLVDALGEPLVRRHARFFVTNVGLALVKSRPGRLEALAGAELPLEELPTSSIEAIFKYGDRAFEQAQKAYATYKDPGLLSDRWDNMYECMAEYPELETYVAELSAISNPAFALQCLSFANGKIVPDEVEERREFFQERYEVALLAQQAANAPKPSPQIFWSSLVTEERVQGLAWADPLIVGELLKVLAEEEKNAMDEATWQRHIDRWQSWLTPSRLEQIQGEARDRTKEGWRDLLRTRPSWFDALETRAPREEIEKQFEDPRDRALILQAANLAKIHPIMRSVSAHADERRTRSSVPRNVPQGAEPISKMADEIIAAAGWEELLLPCVDHITFTTNPSETAGTFLPVNQELALSTDTSSKPEDMPTNIFHETGHGMEWYLMGKVDGQALRDKYVAQTIFSKPEESLRYPQATGLVLGRMSRRFISESFADEMASLVQNPTWLKPEKRELLEQIMQELYPGVDLEVLRARVQTMYGTLFGKSPDVQRERMVGNCGAAEEQARFIDRMEAEEKREKKK